ncbi:hypothetical protein [Limnoglobus roseus]|uniref:Uncharacterized protein n=1 Tax=Limnoglobus roseus TaxID=2598579 RepID=A0A5C1AFU5_9BACT|nr:hypothetical protein [Limnoglobus roseus]QEL17690.1 hypothetical protein PX52LOC_04689 [Limnoglobus roseus]
MFHLFPAVRATAEKDPKLAARADEIITTKRMILPPKPLPLMAEEVVKSLMAEMSEHGPTLTQIEGEKLVDVPADEQVWCQESRNGHGAAHRSGF